jgi:hypothetical protein
LGSLLALASIASAPAQKQVEASDLNLIGKPFASTPNPYHRVDTLIYKGMTPLENTQVRCPAGMAVLFKTDSRSISVTTDWGYIYGGVSTMPISFRGYDLYIKNGDGKWQYAASGTLRSLKQEKHETFKLIDHMDGSLHECMLYLPMYSEVQSCKLTVDSAALIEPLESEFRHKIAVYGSSYTQGVSTDRSGMSYPMQLMRRTGLQFVSLATSGRCMMQPYMADILADIDADAFLFDTFSNPEAPLIRERLIPFIERMIAAHPGKPLIFQRTIYRECRTFDTAAEARDKAQAEAVEELMAQVLANPRYKDVYLITPNASDDHETSVDGTHPNCYGYTLWAESIREPLLDILKRYGIE